MICLLVLSSMSLPIDVASIIATRTSVTLPIGLLLLFSFVFGRSKATFMRTQRFLILECEACLSDAIDALGFIKIRHC
ncbi:hypothetical protein RB25_08200 [Herbaspirillum rubrisubalbicans]|nr:hypothetical protein RB25_08200 [Herbaspirillum rubrisubalbicans]